MFVSSYASIQFESMVLISFFPHVAARNEAASDRINMEEFCADSFSLETLDGAIKK